MMTHSDAALLFKTLADETRLRIVEMLSCGELCACNILEKFAITQPTLSYHMRLLTESGLVHARKDGVWMRYSLNEEMLNEIHGYFGHITTEQDTCPCKEPKDAACKKPKDVADPVVENVDGKVTP